MKNIIQKSNILTHITDVGAPSGKGVDSTRRIERQYQRLGIVPCIISAGQSPIDVAFVACTDISPQAKKNVEKLLKQLKIDKPKLQPVALNSAPRNSLKICNNAREDHIYRIKSSAGETFLVYGLEVLRWVLEFYGRNGMTVEKILSIIDFIPDTSSGSQFRSGEYLPIVHFLEAKDLLDLFSVRKNVELNQIAEIFIHRKKSIIVVSPDEYDNGRLIVDKSLIENILLQQKIKIPGICNGTIAVKKSLTEVIPGELSVWLSSNYFPNKNLGVLNIGTRWKLNTTSTTDDQVIKLSEKLTNLVGKYYKVELIG